MSDAINFREHRGLLADSMETAVVVAGLPGLWRHLQRKVMPELTAMDSSRLRFEPYGGDDDRTGWKNVHTVRLEGHGVLGFCSRLDGAPPA